MKAYNNYFNLKKTQTVLLLRNCPLNFMDSQNIT